MKGAHRDPVDHARTTQPHAGESFIDTLWLPGLILIGIGTVLIAGTVAATAYTKLALRAVAEHGEGAPLAKRLPRLPVAFAQFLADSVKEYY